MADQCRRVANPRRAHEISRVRLEFDPDQGRTHQSFKDECDINNIVATYARTGIVPHMARGKPQYGDVPDVDLHAAACAQAEIRSAMEEGWSPDALESPETDDSPEEQVTPEGSEAQPLTASEEAVNNEAAQG